LFLFHDFIFGPGILLDANPSDYDPWRTYADQETLDRTTHNPDGLASYLPRRVELTRAVRSGRIPLWNPYVFAGAPFFADPQSRVLYPVSLLLVASDPARAIGYELAIHMFIAMLGMFLFMRRIRAGTTGSALAAVGYALSSCFFVRLAHGTFATTASWIPLLFYGYERSRKSERTGTLILIGSFSMAYLAGFPQVLALGVGSLVLYAGYVGLSCAQGGRRREELARSARVIAVSGVLSLLVVAVQLVPFIEYTRNSIGLGIELETMRHVYQAPPLLLTRSVWPTLFGHPIEGTDWSGLTRETAELTHPDFMIYCGAGVLLAALAGLVFAKTSRRIRLLLGLLLVSMGLATSPLLMKVAYAICPIFRLARISRISVVGCFALSSMAGIGFSMAGRRAEGKGSRNFLIVLFVATAAIALGSLAFVLGGDSLLHGVMARARSLPEAAWLKPLAVRSAKIQRWARAEGFEWFHYERMQLARAVAYAVAGAVLLGLHVWPGSRRRRIKRIAGILFVGLVVLDAGSMVRSYMVVYPRDSIFKARGIEFLRRRLGADGDWRIHNLSRAYQDERGLPPNTNQIFGIPSLSGRATVLPQAYVDLMEATSHMEVPPWLRARQVPLSPTTVLLTEVASARYLVAGKSGTPYVASPLLGMVRSGDGSGCSLQMLEVGGESRPAICQRPDRPIVLRIDAPQVAALDFAVGCRCDSRAEHAEVVFTLAYESEKGRVEFRRSLEARPQEERWHEFRLDISQVSGSPASIGMAVSTPKGARSNELVAGWSGLALVYGDCAFRDLGGAYEIEAGPERSSLRLRLKSQASEIPLDIASSGRHLRTLWIAFPSDTGGRWVDLDVAGRDGEVVTIRSDSTFALEMCKRVVSGNSYSGLELVYDADLHVYENFGAVEKGICISEDWATIIDVRGGPVLKLGAPGRLNSARCGTCRIVSYEPERIELQVSSRSDGYLIFNDLWYPGWLASVDGHRGDITRTGTGFRAIKIAKGDHRVIMEFKPASLRIGLILTCLGLGLTLLYSRIGPRIAAKKP
jgi:hypothetical protein